jgi:hypothetical protein
MKQTEIVTQRRQGAKVKRRNQIAATGFAAIQCLLFNLCVFAPLADEAKGGDGAKSALREILVLVPCLRLLRTRIVNLSAVLSSDLDRLKPCGRIGDLILGSDKLDLFSVPFRG